MAGDTDQAVPDRPMLYRLSEAQALLRVKETKLRTFVREKKLTMVKLGSRSSRITADSLGRLIENLQREAP